MAPSIFDEILCNITTDKQQYIVITDSTANPEFLPSGMDAADPTPESHKTAVFTIMGILICISLTVTGAVFVFYKKRNSVFSLQPSESSRNKDYELDDMNTEGDSASSDKGSMESVRQPEPSVTVPLMQRLCEYDKDSILYIPYIPEDQSKSDFYQLLPKSKSYSSEIGYFTQNSKCLSDSKPSVLSSVLKNSKRSSASCLPFSRSYSCSSFGNNYQSMLVSAEMEPWIPQYESTSIIKGVGDVCNDISAPRCHQDDSFTTNSKRYHQEKLSSDVLLCSDHCSEENIALYKQQGEDGYSVVKTRTPQEIQSVVMNQETLAGSDLANPFIEDCHDYCGRQINERRENPHTCKRSNLIILPSNQT